VAKARSDYPLARQRYGEGLAIFERLGMPEAAQVRQMLAALDDSGPAAQPLSEGEALVRLTQASEGQAAAEVVQAIDQLSQKAGLSEEGRAYLAALAAAAGQPSPAGLAGLQEAGLAYLSAADESRPLAIALAFSLARLCDRQGYPAGAAAVQPYAIALLRQGRSPEEQQTLSVALYNHAGYLAQLGRLDEAAAAMAEVVALDERLGLADLEQDRAALARLKAQRAGGPPPAPAPAGSSLPEWLAALADEAAGLPPEEQVQVRQFIEEAARLSPDEQAALARRQLDDIAEQVAGAALAARQAGQVAELLPQLEAAAAQYAEGEAPGSAYADLAQFVRAVIALLQGTPVEPVAPDYVERLALLRRQLG